MSIMKGGTAQIQNSSFFKVILELIGLDDIRYSNMYKTRLE